MGFAREEQDNQCPTGRPVISATLAWSAGLNIRRLQVREDLRQTANTITHSPHHHQPQQHNQPSTAKDTAEAVAQQQTHAITIYCTSHFQEESKIPQVALCWIDALHWTSFGLSGLFLLTCMAIWYTVKKVIDSLYFKKPVNQLL